MESDSVDRPQISQLAVRLFAQYSYWYLNRSFRAVRLAGRSQLTGFEELPLVVYMNHASWWDPLVALALSQKLWPERSHYGPIDSSALAKYKFFEHLGFFGIEPGGIEGASRFLKIGGSILATPKSALWITSQGEFADPRKRPVQLRSGLGHLLRRTGPLAVVPLAVEYPFWFEKYPEVLARFGTPLVIRNNKESSGRQWTSVLELRLEEVQDTMAEDSIARRADAFEIVLQGSAGVGGVYDLWRGAKARLQGVKFERAHGQKL